LPGLCNICFIVHAQDAGDAPSSRGILTHLDAIDECFRFDTIEEIYAALERRKDAWGEETLRTLHG
jgi:hypothetical protein